MIFKEVQTYRGTWLMFLILILELPMIILVAAVILSSESNSQEAIWIIPALLLLMGTIFMFIMSLRLELRIEPDEIKYRFIPFFSKWKSITREEIKEVQVISYSPISDYGGWGLKGNKTTKAYSILGDHGLLINHGQKKKIMIGTQKGKELKEFIDHWKEEGRYE